MHVSKRSVDSWTQSFSSITCQGYQTGDSTGDRLLQGSNPSKEWALARSEGESPRSAMTRSPGHFVGPACWSALFERCAGCPSLGICCLRGWESSDTMGGDAEELLAQAFALPFNGADPGRQRQRVTSTLRAAYGTA